MNENSFATSPFRQKFIEFAAAAFILLFDASRKSFAGLFSQRRTVRFRIAEAENLIAQSEFNFTVNIFTTWSHTHAFIPNLQGVISDIL